MAVGWRWVMLFGSVGALGACGEAPPPPLRPDVLTLELGGAPRRLPEVLATVQSDSQDAPREVEIPRAVLAPRPRFGRLREGETLSGLSARELGTARRWREIAELNGIDDPTRVPPGTRLKLPPQ